MTYEEALKEKKKLSHIKKAFIVVSFLNLPSTKCTDDIWAICRIAHISFSEVLLKINTSQRN